MHILLTIIAALAMMVIVNFGSHFFLFFSIVRFFEITDSWWQAAVGITLLILACSYVVSSILAHLHDNVFTRNLYTLSATWLGYLTYLVFACVFVWGVIGTVGFFDGELSSWKLMTLAIIMGLSAIGIGIYGLWNAANIQITEVTAPLRNLPEHWDGKRIVQISDVHMGHTLRQDFLWEIVDRINTIHPEFVAITGDFYDGMDGSLEHLAEPLNDIKAKYGTFYVDGNHETYLGTARSLKAISATKANILHDRVENLDGLQVAGISYPEGRGGKKDAFAELRKLDGFDATKPYVFLYHKPWRIQDDGKLGSGLALFGHTHKGQIFPFGLIVWMIFGKFGYGYERVGDLNVYVSSGIGTWGPPMRVGTKSEIVVITLKKE